MHVSNAPGSTGVHIATVGQQIEQVTACSTWDLMGWDGGDRKRRPI